MQFKVCLTVDINTDALDEEDAYFESKDILGSAIGRFLNDPCINLLDEDIE